MKNLKYVLFAFVIGFLSLSNVYAGATCVYENGNFKITCSVRNNEVTCNNNSSAGIVLSNSNGVDYSDFVRSSGNISCVDDIYLDLRHSGDTLDIINVYSAEKVCKNNSDDCMGLPLNKGDSQGDSTNEGFGSGNSSGGGFGKDSFDEQFDDKEDIENQFVTEYFCKGPVQGVFTTLGWIFYILKIIIPIVLIIFGCIDFGKAILASKDGEIKKAGKSLLMRFIAGIIIFFVPVIIGFIIKFIDNDNIYKGTFWDCTKCMIDPNPSSEDGYTCSTLMGGE